MTMLIAGHETTAAVLTWTVYCLTSHPQVVARVHQEVRITLCPVVMPSVTCMFGAVRHVVSAVLVMRLALLHHSVLGHVHMMLTCAKLS